jgi:Transglycosylase SLT domain
MKLGPVGPVAPRPSWTSAPAGRSKPTAGRGPGGAGGRWWSPRRRGSAGRSSAGRGSGLKPGARRRRRASGDSGPGGSAGARWGALRPGARRRPRLLVLATLVLVAVVAAPSFFALAGAPPTGRARATRQTGATVDFDPAACARLPSPESRLCDFGTHFNAAAAETQVDARLLAAVAYAESSYVADTIECRQSSEAGALGLMQFLPEIASEWRVDPCNPASAIPGAARKLRHHHDEFRTWELALAAYNAGSGAVRQAGGIPRNGKTERYVPQVMAKWQEYQALFPLVSGGASGGPLGSTARYVDHNNTPRMQALLDDVIPRFGQGRGTPGCWRPGRSDGDHPNGRACDLIMSSPLNTMPTPEYLALGWELACYVVENAERLGVHYVIWQRQIWSTSRPSQPGGRCTADSRPSGGWRPYTRYAGCTRECLRLNHYDHVHISVR